MVREEPPASLALGEAEVLLQKVEGRRNVLKEELGRVNAQLAEVMVSCDLMIFNCLYVCVCVICSCIRMCVCVFFLLCCVVILLFIYVRTCVFVCFVIFIIESTQIIIMIQVDER